VVDETPNLTRRRTGLVKLIKLVIKKEDGHGLINDPALVGVCVTDVWGSTDDDRVLLVGGIVDGH